MTITHIVAASLNNVIGKNNDLVWKLPNDMKFFKNKTWGLPVVMGRKTFESFKGKALPGRYNIVITRKEEVKVEGVTVVDSLEKAIAICKQQDFNEVMIIGGGEIYKQSLPITNKVLLTRVEAVIDGDTTYPELNEKEWQLTFEEKFEADDKHAYAYSFQTWVRK